MYRGSKGFGFASGATSRPGGPAVEPSVASSAPNSQPSPPLYCRILADARRATGFSEPELALRIGTSPEVIRALESGYRDRYPEWPELELVVRSLLGAMRIDPRPVLLAIEQELTAGSAAAAAPAGSAQPRHGQRSSRRQGTTAGTRGGAAVAPRALLMRLRVRVAERAAREAARLTKLPRGASTAGATPRRLVGAISGRRVRRLSLAIAVPAALAALVSQTTFVGATAATLPAPLGRLFARAVDHLRVQFAPVRDGLRWIEVEDPRSRRTDKLQTARR